MAEQVGAKQFGVKKVTLNDETLIKLMTIHAAATAEDIAEVAAIVMRATNAAEAVDIVTITPGIAARLFFDHNKQNREWQAKTSLDYADAITRGEWHFTNQGIGFLRSGNVGDGQYRLAAIALAGIPIKLLVTYGMKEEAILHLDTGRVRKPWDATHILDREMTDQQLKVALLKSTFSYLFRATKDATWRIRPGNKHVVELVRIHHVQLAEAIEMGSASVYGIAKPTLKTRVAQGVAFLCLVTDWPGPVIIANLATFQTGVNVQGEDSPFFVVAKLLERDATKREKTSLTAQYAATVKAFQLSQMGVKAVKASLIRDAMNVHLPDPTFPTSSTT